MQRHRTDHAVLDSFSDEVLVECPGCGGRAVVRLRPLGESRRAGPFVANHEATLACPACGRSARRSAFVRFLNGPADPVFELPVWLRVRCGGNTLWAYNERHLEALEAFVRATLRERRPHPELGWRNASWTSRIPRWISAARNREMVLQGIARLRRERPGRG